MTHSCMTRLIHAWHDTSMCDMTHSCAKDSFIPHMHRYGVNQKVAQDLISCVYFILFSSKAYNCMPASNLSSFLSHKKFMQKSYTHPSSFWFASIFHLFCVIFFWTQNMRGMDMGLVEREMDCIAPYMRPTCRLKRRLPHAKSPPVQRCHTN